MTPNAEAIDTGRAHLLHELNGKWHRWALLIYAFIVVAHWLEHVAQAFQIWGLNWERPEARGALGLVFPWLVTSEWLHYGYAAVMLIAFAVLLPGFTGRSRVWWGVALGIQVWHHFEHLLLLAQVQLGTNLFGAEAPTSLIQLVVPRVELHLIYNAIVTIPMLVALWIHMHPHAGERHEMTCGCAAERRVAPATV